MLNKIINRFCKKVSTGYSSSYDHMKIQETINNSLKLMISDIRDAWENEKHIP